MSEDAKHPGGRPLKFANAAELDRRIKAYFRSCDPHIITVKRLKYPTITDSKGRKHVDEYGIPEVIRQKVMSEQKPYTVTGLALYLGTSRQTLLDYEERNEFSDAIKEAKLKIESFAEMNLYGSKSSVAGTIFSLANNFGWKNKVEQENTGESKVIIETRHQSDADDD